MDFCYKFPVVRGVQAGREYYIAMVPLKMLAKLFPVEDEFVLPEYRAQRKLNETRIPEIRDYILKNKSSYVFSALAASIDGKFVFKGNEDGNTGILEVAMDARFLINDGQHRKAAILEAINSDEALKEETISVVLYADQGLTRSQQMFTDLNKHAVKTSNSISELYDSRDKLAVETRKLVSENSFLNEYVDKERDILGKFSSSLFTLNTFYTANKRILKRSKCESDYSQFIKEYWDAVTKHMVPWSDLVNKEISKIELRERYIASQAIVIQAFGKVGSFLYEEHISGLDELMKPIERINWKRSSEAWKGRVIRADGRLSTSNDAITLIANTIKNEIKLPLTEDELFIEEKYKGLK